MPRPTQLVAAINAPLITPGTAQFALPILEPILVRLNRPPALAGIRLVPILKLGTAAPGLRLIVLPFITPRPAPLVAAINVPLIISGTVQAVYPMITVAPILPVNVRLVGIMLNGLMGI